MFGGLSVSPDGADLPPEIAHIARDPMDPLFDEDAFVAAVRRRGSGIKRILLDQTVVSGVGNIYADEALWRAQLHGDRLGNRLRRTDVLRVLAEVRAVLAAALAEGGTSFDALYVNVNGESGYFDRSLHAYGQEGRACDRCGTAIVRVSFMNRSSYFCPVCQPRPRAAPGRLNRLRDLAGPVDRGPRLGGDPLAAAAAAGEQRLAVEALPGGVPAAQLAAAGDLERAGHTGQATAPGPD